jgi:hypothetical protein
MNSGGEWFKLSPPRPTSPCIDPKSDPETAPKALKGKDKSAVLRPTFRSVSTARSSNCSPCRSAFFTSVPQRIQTRVVRRDAGVPGGVEQMAGCLEHAFERFDLGEKPLEIALKRAALGPLP